MTTTTHIPANEMPDTIIGNDGRTYYRTMHTGTTLSACRFGEGHTCHEYWGYVDGYEEDTFRLHAIDATKFWLD